MPLRFWRRIGIIPGLTLNLSKSGASLSLGPPGAKLTISQRSTRLTLGIPGTGLFYTTTFPGAGRGGKRGDSATAPAVPQVRPEDRLTLGFFKRLVTPHDEEALVDGCRELAIGNEKKALEHLRQATHLADGAFLAGFLALKMGLLEEAENYLDRAAHNHSSLGRHFSKYRISATVSIPITREVSAHASPDLRGALLCLVEVFQRQKNWENAIACLERLLALDPADVVVKLSLAELLLAARPGDKTACERVVRLAEGLNNETPLHTGVLLYKARALRCLGLPDAARKTLTEALSRRSGRPERLLLALRYERALVFQDLGQTRLARSELEKIYADDPTYEDVAARLGL